MEIVPKSENVVFIEHKGIKLEVYANTNKSIIVKDVEKNCDIEHPRELMTDLVAEDEVEFKLSKDWKKNG